MYHPTSENNEGKCAQKGRRYCFVAAIRGDGISSKAGLILNSVWIFSPPSKDGHTGDYHKVFNRDNYVNLFKNQLLPNLNELSLIILDNARYHKCMARENPKASALKKVELLQAISSAGVEFDSEISATEARVLLCQWQKENVEPEFVS